MTCIDCGQDTLSDGICIDCTNKRIDQYPKLKEKWNGFVKLSREGFYSFDCEPEDGSIWGGCVKREKWDQLHQQLADKINENQKLKAEIESLKKQLGEKN